MRVTGAKHRNKEDKTMPIAILAVLAILAGFSIGSAANAQSASYNPSHPEYHPQAGDTWKKAYHPTAAASERRTTITAAAPVRVAARPVPVVAASATPYRVRPTQKAALPVPPRFVPPPGPSPRVLAEGRRSERLAAELLPQEGVEIILIETGTRMYLCAQAGHVRVLEAESEEDVLLSYWDRRFLYEAVFDLVALTRAKVLPHLPLGDCPGTSS